MSERDVRDQAFAEKRRNAPARAVEELLGDDDVCRRVLFLQSADRRSGYDSLDAQQFQGVDVGAKRQFGRRDAMPAPMPRQKGDTRAFERPDDEVVRRHAEWSLNSDLMRVGQSLHPIQTTAADDPNLRFFHYP